MSVLGAPRGSWSLSLRPPSRTSRKLARANAWEIPAALGTVVEDGTHPAWNNALAPVVGRAGALRLRLCAPAVSARRTRGGFPATLHACARRTSAVACTDRTRHDTAGAIADQARPDRCSSTWARRVARLPEDPSTEGLGHGVFDLGATDSRRHQRVPLRALAARPRCR
jgi:hypothetical protein